MINGLGVLGWGVGGIEAEAAMLGQPITMLIPQVVGFELTGKLARRRDRDGSRAHGHARCCASRASSASSSSSSAPGSIDSAARGPRDDRATWRPNTARPCGVLPDRRRDARATCASRAAPARTIELVEAYAKEQGLWRDATPDRVTRDAAEARPRRPSSRASRARSVRRTASAARRRAQARLVERCSREDAPAKARVAGRRNGKDKFDRRGRRRS